MKPTPDSSDYILQNYKDNFEKSKTSKIFDIEKTRPYLRSSMKEGPIPQIPRRKLLDLAKAA